MSKRRLLAAALLSCSRLSLAAELDPVVVTATRTAQTADQSLTSITVITRPEIERRQARSVQDLMRGAAGVSIASNGGRGKTTSVFLRGTEADHVLVMVDGVKVGSATLGTTAFQDIPIEQVERIEIVRGPRSSLYGSEAIGGVIQIFTRKGGGPPARHVSIGGGSDRSIEAAAGLSGGGERAWFAVGASGADTDGFNACDGRPSPDGAGCFTTEPDRDGYRNRSISVRAGYRFDNGAAIDLHALRSRSHNQFDGASVNEADSAQQVLGGSLRFAPLARWQMTLAAGRSSDRSDNSKDGNFKSRFETVRQSLSLQNDIGIARDQLVTLGADYQDDRVGGTTAYVVDSRHVSGLFVQYQGTFGAHDTQLSLRQDINPQFGHRVTGSSAWGVALGKGLRLVASFGTAFKAPTFNELYFPGFGNPDLRPEASRSVEIGLRGRSGRTWWSLDAYESRIDDLIAFDSRIFAPANVDQARLRGIEAVAAIRLDRWYFDANLTLLDPKNLSAGANGGNVLPRRARQSLRLDADRTFGRHRFGATLFAAGGRYDDLANARALGGYATLDLRAEAILTRDWQLLAQIENLFDKDYQTAALFNSPGRSLTLTLRYRSS